MRCKSRRVILDGRDPSFSWISGEISGALGSIWKLWHCRSVFVAGKWKLAEIRSRASLGYLISESRPSGVLFVGRRRVQRLELDVITGGIDLLDGSRPISRPVTSVIAIVDPFASASRGRPRGFVAARDICICHGTESPAACNAPYVDEQCMEQTRPVLERCLWYKNPSRFPWILQGTSIIFCRYRASWNINS